MPEYLAPGVYIEEISGPRPIEGVGTSTAALVGLTERGPTDPQFISNWNDYFRIFGGFATDADSYLPYAVKGFFDNGGQRMFIARVHRSDATPATRSLAAGDTDLVFTAVGPGAWGNNLVILVRTGSRDETDDSRFRITILYYQDPITVDGDFVNPFDPSEVANPKRREPTVLEDFDELGFDPKASGYVIKTINNGSRLVTVSWDDDDAAKGRPAPDPDVFLQFEDGSDGSADLGISDFTGDGTAPADERTGLEGLKIIDEVALIGAPDHVNETFVPELTRSGIVDALVIQCELLKDRFAIFSTKESEGDVAAIRPLQDTKYGAVYHPWVRVINPETNDSLLVPSVGHVLGIIARTDIERGVHKAPANAVVRGIVNVDLSNNRKPLRYKLDKAAHGILNPKGVNVIRDFRSDRRGIRLFGARTMSSDSEWKYINVRRLFIFVEESVEEGTQWVVFEPNDPSTWAKVRRSVGNFLESVWRSGALFGATREEAFFVKCDRTTMSQDDIDNGRLITEVGMAPVKPAEFVIFRFSQKTSDAST